MNRADLDRALARGDAARTARKRVLMLHDFSFQTPDELLAGLTKSNRGQSAAMPKSDMGQRHEHGLGKHGRQ